MMRSSLRQILGVGELDVVFGARDDGHTLADRLQQRRIVGGARDVAAMCGEQHRNRKPCGVWARNRPSRGTVAPIRLSATSFNVSATGTAGIAPAACSRAFSKAGIVPGGINGRAASCTSTTSVPRRPAPPAQPDAVLMSGPPGTGAGAETALAPLRRRRRHRPAEADRPGEPTPRRPGGSPAFRRAAETFSASGPNRLLTRRRPGSCYAHAGNVAGRPIGVNSAAGPMGRAVLKCHIKCKGNFALHVGMCVVICPIDEQAS